jgi:predicted metalloprotease
VAPFYCPEDHRVYIDLAFYRELRDRFGAPGDFAQAYVIAHEVGHHVQNLLGLSDKVQAARGRVSETEYNKLSVRLELQADFFAGVWAHYADRAKNVVEPGDIDEALRAASVIGDDTLQRRSKKVMSCPSLSLTAPPSNASAGSAKATRPATSARATPSPPATCNFSCSLFLSASHFKLPCL